MPLRHRLITAVAGLLLVLTACSRPVTGTPQTAPGGGAPASGSALPPAPTPAPIRFRDCTQDLESAGLQLPSRFAGKLSIGCGQLQVPLDYAHPDGRQISLVVARVHDSDNTHSLGTLQVNPGGPGASALDFLLGFLGEVPATLLTHFDLVAFDPRGVGVSSPIKCLTTQQKDTLLAQAPDVTTPAGFAAADRNAAELANACERAYGSALPFYNTENTARDMDQVRQAVGDSRMNYLGFSYGTELGWVYAHLFPSRVRVLVLDGAVDPNTSGVAQAAEQLQGFEKAFDQFAAYCRTTSPCSRLGDPRAAALRITSAARSRPLATGGSRKLTYGLAFTGILQALYSKSLWPQLASGLVAASNGNGGGLLRLADQYNERSANGTYTNILEANTAISCNDSPRGPSDATIRTTAASWVHRFPLFGRWAGSELFSCQQWQLIRTIPPKPRAATPTKVLVIGNLHDPATPYQGAEDLTRDLGNAELLTWNGQGHTSYLQGSSCIDNYVNRYLVTKALPAMDTTCPR